MVDGQLLKERKQLLFNFNKKVFYEIVKNISTHSEHCSKHELHGDIQAPCLARDARLKGKLFLGGTLQCDDYEESFVDHKGDTVRINALMSAHVNVPVRAVGRVGKFITFDEYWNWEDSVHHDNFVVPSICQNAQMSKHEPRTVQQVMNAERPTSPTWRL